MEDPVDLALKGTFNRQYTLVVVDTLLDIRQHPAALVFLHGAVENAVCGRAFFRQGRTNFAQFRRGGGFDYAASVQYAIDLVRNGFVGFKVGQFRLDRRRAFRMQLEERADAIEALHQVFEDQKVRTVEGGALNL